MSANPADIPKKKQKSSGSFIEGELKVEILIISNIAAKRINRGEEEICFIKRMASSFRKEGSIFWVMATMVMLEKAITAADQITAVKHRFRKKDRESAVPIV
jgi:hypothetical protein